MPSRRSDASKNFKRRTSALLKQKQEEEERLETLRWTTNGDLPRDIRTVGSMQLPLSVMVPQMDAFLDKASKLPYKMPPQEYIKYWFCGKVEINRFLFNVLLPCRDVSPFLGDGSKVGPCLCLLSKLAFYFVMLDTVPRAINAFTHKKT